MAERALPMLDLSGSLLQVANNWKNWKRAFEYYAEGKGLDNTRKKTSQLLHYAGMEVQNIFEDLDDPENIPFERHVFWQLALTDGESVDKFVVRLRRQARYCNFGEVMLSMTTYEIS